nr:hypothetical protein [uncultured Undibacterium sp.]
MSESRRVTFFRLLSIFVGSMIGTAIYEIAVRGWQNADWYKALFMGFFFVIWACIFPSSFLVEKKPKEKQ